MKKPKRSEWMEGLLIAEQVIAQGGDREDVYLSVGCYKQYLENGVDIWQIGNFEATRGALDYLHFKGIGYREA